MMTYEQIKELIHLVSEQRLQGLEIERSGFRLKISGFSATPTVAAVPVAAAAESAVAPAMAPPAVAAAPPPAAPSPAAGATGGGHVVTSPIVGTFYASPSPDADPFVRPGDRVRKGQVLCIVEAMKLMNEIECDVDGIVAEVFPKNAQPVEYGEPLFGVRAD